MVGKRRRDTATPNTELIEIYEDLANEDQEIRLRAAHNLLSKFASPPWSSPEKIKPIVIRLFRGLCSSRKAARPGFSVAITELLTQIFQSPVNETGLSLDDVLEILEKHTVPDGATTGQDERDHYIGRLFGAEAIIKSCILFSPEISLQVWRRLLQLIADLAHKKQWLRQECGWLIFTSVEHLRSITLDSELAVAIIQSLETNNLIRTPEGVAVWLEVKKTYPNARLPKNIWKHRDPLHKHEVAALAEIMKDARAKQQPGSGPSDPPPALGLSSQQLHFSWNILLSELYHSSGGSDKGSSKRIDFAKFWQEIVGESLLLPSSSHERKRLAFSLLAKVLTFAPPESLQHIFTPRAVSLLVTNLEAGDRYLNRSAKRTIEALQNRAKSEPGVVPHVVQGLVLGASGVHNFDAISKTKTIRKLLVAANLASCQALVPIIGSAIEEPQTSDESEADARRKSFTDILVVLYSRTFSMATDPKNEAVSAPKRVAKMILDVLVAMGYAAKPLGSDGRMFKPPPTSQCRAYVRSRIRTCLDQSLRDRQNKLDLLRHTIDSLKDIHTQKDSEFAITEFDAATQEIVDGAWIGLSEMKKAQSRTDPGSGKAKPAEVLELLYSLAMLQLYDGDADTPALLEDLNAYEDNLTSPRKSLEKDAAEGSDSVVEILLGFASKPARFFHQTILYAFQSLASEVSRTGLDSLIRVLETNESSVRTQNLFDVEEISNLATEMVDEIQSNDHPHSSDGSVSGTVDSDVESLSEGSSTSSSLEDSVSDDPENGQDELAAFDAKLAAALATRRGQDDLEAEDTEGSEEDLREEDMDEKEMEALDQKLAEVFRARNASTHKRQERKETKEAVINFKKRVLDLIEVYLKEEQLSPLTLELVLPLIRAARKSSVKQILDRARDILQGFCLRCKGSNVPVIDQSDLAIDAALEKFKATHEEAGLADSRGHAAACSRASILLVKVLVKANVDVGRMVDVYAETRKRQLRDVSCKVQPHFFTEWSNWCTSARDQLAT